MVNNNDNPLNNKALFISGGWFVRGDRLTVAMNFFDDESILGPVSSTGPH